MSNERVAPETLAVGALASSATVPIVWDETHDGSTVPCVGTGTLFRIGEHSFLVTAAHVMEGDAPERRVIFPDGRMTELHGVLARIDGIESRGRADVAVAVLLPEVARELEARGRQFLSENNLPSRDVAPGKARFFAGFPVEGLNWRQPLPTVFALAERPAPTDLVEPVDEELHFFLSYGDRVRNVRGELMDAPRLQGVSGATIWGQVAPTRSGAIWQASDHVRVFGIETAVGRSRTWIRCTRIGVVARMMCEIDPALRPIIEPRFMAQGGGAQ